MNHLLLLSLFTAADLCLASSTLLSGGTIVAFDQTEEALRVIRNGSLLIEDDRIAGIFQEGEVPDLEAEYDVIDVTDKIVTPGFVDTHRHGWQTGLKTIASNVSLWEYYGRFSEFASAGLVSAEDVYIGQLAGLFESLNAGVTTTLDHAHHTWSDETAVAGLEASIESGARVFWAYTFHNVTNYTVSEQFVNFRDIAEGGSFQGTRTSLGIACDFFGPDPVPDQVQGVVDLALEFNVSVLTVHTLEGPFGWTNSPEDLHAANILNTSIPVVFSHASFLSYRGRDLLKSANQYISITPESEMHYGHTHPRSHLAQDQASLGVDTHATFSTDLLTQARIWLQKVRYTLYDGVLNQWRVPSNNPMSVNQAFLLATRNGGLALRRPDLGVISEGAKADLVIWNGGSPALLGWNDPVAAVILHASVGDIEHVLVDGEFVKRDGKLVAPDYDSVRTRLLESSRRLQDTFLSRPRPVPEEGEEFFGVGAELMEVVEVDILRGDGTGYGTQFLG